MPSHSQALPGYVLLIDVGNTQHYHQQYLFLLVCCCNSQQLPLTVWHSVQPRRGTAGRGQSWSDSFYLHRHHQVIYVSVECEKLSPKKELTSEGFTR